MDFFRNKNVTVLDAMPKNRADSQGSALLAESVITRLYSFQSPSFALGSHAVIVLVGLTCKPIQVMPI